jgi:polysaccharide export outer membrane protein
MNKLIKSNNLFYLIYILIGVFCSSCITSKQIRYFQNVPVSSQKDFITPTPYVPSVIHTDDILTIAVATNEIAATAGVNALSNTSSTDPTSGGYTVDSLGYIQMPTLGSIKVANLTIQQATEAVKQVASKNFNDVVVVVKIRSFKVTLIGEVTKPGVMYLSTPNTNIIELLSMAGDLTPYAKRDNLLLMRHNTNNTISTYRVNLTNSSVFTSPVYYLQSNDVLYVEPNSSKAISSDQTFSRNLTVGTLGLSVLTTILYLFRR